MNKTNTLVVKKKQIFITGASGFIGKNLLKQLNKKNKYSISIFSRSDAIVSDDQKIRIIKGDLLNKKTLDGCLLPENTIIHLAYMWNQSQYKNLQATENLFNACINAGVKRFIHISTAAVVGRAKDQWVDEKSPSNPKSQYGKTKLAIEDMLLNLSVKFNIDLVILRPTSIYGINGAPLAKLCKDIKNKNWMINYLRSCLFGKRAMNLVHINNVIDTMEFAINYPDKFNGEILIVSEDEIKENNFIDVEKMIREELKINQYPMKILEFPRVILKTILKIKNSNIINTQCRFSSEKIKKKYKLSFNKEFQIGVREYAKWYGKFN